MQLNWANVIDHLWPEIEAAILPCIVGLGWTEHLEDECPDEDASIFEQHRVRPRLASGCIFEFDGLWFYLTAGHVIGELREASDLGLATKRFEFITGFHGDAIRHVPLPFNAHEVFAINEQALDYGLFPISPDVGRQLIDHGVRYAGTEMVARPDEQFDGYVLIGFPDQEYRIDSIADTIERREMSVRILFPMLAIDEVHADNVPTQYRRLIGKPFVGQLVSLTGRDQTGQVIELNSIVGMSGGPIFGLRFNDDGLELKLVAVQSHWLSNEKIIRGSRVVYLAGTMAHQLIRGFDVQELDIPSDDPTEVPCPRCGAAMTIKRLGADTDVPCVALCTACRIRWVERDD